MEKAASQASTSCKPLTTFVQTDSNNFREVVQQLTGPPKMRYAAQGGRGEGGMKSPSSKGPTSKLHERRQYMRPKLEIVKPPLSFKPTTSPSRLESSSILTSPASTPSRRRKQARNNKM
ncbi:hypothetical protein DITRI_Ditri18aG0031200 [Diplodiscus trichospermus]